MFFFLFSCSRYCRQWELITIRADCPPVNYAKIYLCPDNEFCEMEIELLCTGYDTQLFLNTTSLIIPPSQNGESLADVIIAIDDIQYFVSAERFEGGQRLLLPQEVQQLIIMALIEDREIVITCGRYKTNIISKNFRNIYCKILPTCS